MIIFIMLFVLSICSSIFIVDFIFPGFAAARDASMNFILLAEVPLVQGMPVQLEVERRPGVNLVNGLGDGFVLHNNPHLP
jgi:hypothetical protein